MKNALVVTYLNSLSLVRTLATKGFRVSVAGVGPGRVLRLSRRCSDYVCVAESEADLASGNREVLERIVALARKSPTDLIVGGDVAGSMCVERLKAMLPDCAYFPVPEPALLRTLDDKWSFFRFLIEHGLPTPRTWLIETPDQARDLPLPLVLKPRIGSGGVGVVVVRDAAARDAQLGGGNAHLSLGALAQEFVEGEDVDLSFLADRGRLVAWVVQTRRADGTLDFIEDKRIVDLGRRLAEACSYTGLAHLDMRYEGPSRAGVKFIECNPRFWGSYHFTLGLGVDFLGLGLQMAEGRSPAAIEHSPTGHGPGLVWSIRRILSGRMDLPAPARAYLGQKLSDPFPELYRGACKILGRSETIF